MAPAPKYLAIRNNEFSKLPENLGRVASYTLSILPSSFPPQGCNCVNKTLCVTYSIDIPNIVKNSKSYTHSADVIMQPTCVLF